MAGDRDAWDPGPDRDFWQILRLAVLYFLWVARCEGREQGRPLSALAVVARIVHYLRARIRDDALRAFCPVAEYGVLGGEWLPSRPPLHEGQFRARWSHHEVLCRFLPGSMGVSTLDVRLSLVSPVRPPPP